ncbi:uncharacterized protein LOC135167919 isoform X4 [Diachasmimorpha longicaudata]|uniref:uncharacterized protein LOC135167919 isoform X4 n=1 Tax=Diachasmimorpha longicaudata TaxID=58733 RepID=UPI0030B8CA21
MNMVVSHRETSISSNIRAIIEQLNLNPVERRRLIDRNCDNGRIRPVSSPAKITIGVYGSRDKNIDVKPMIDTYKRNQDTPNITFSKEKIEEKLKEKNEIPVEKKHKKINVDALREKNQNTTTIEIFEDDPVTENPQIDNWREKRDEKTRIEIIRDEDKETLRIEILKDANPESIVTPVTTPSGKVTIGVWGQNRGEPRAERPGSIGKIISKQEVDEEKICVVVSRSKKPEMRQRVPPEEKDIIEVTRTQQDVVERITATPKEDLPDLESASLSHTAAHHRIAIRPKNRRPPRRPIPSSTSTITIISESSDNLDSLEPIISSTGSSPVEPKAPSILRKSSSRLSRNCELFEELESKLPRKPASVVSLSPDSLDSTARTTQDTSENEEIREMKPVTRRPSNRVSKGSDVFEELESRLPRRRSINRLSKSPDSLENSFSKSSEGFDNLTEHEGVKPSVRRHQTSMSKSSEAFDMISETVEMRAMPRRLPTAISKSTEGFDKLIEHNEPRPVARRLLLPISKSSDLVSKSSDSLEVLEALTSDDSIERRRSSFEMRPRRGVKVMSMSSENFENLEQVQKQKRNSASDVSLSRGKRHCQIISKSSESFEAMELSLDGNRGGLDLAKYGWRSEKRVSSESSDNFETEEKSERKSRRPKRVSSSTVIDIFPRDELGEGEKSFGRKSRVHKSSESSELGSTDTLDSERRNKSDSTETLDSLEKDEEREGREEEMLHEEKHDKHDSWIKPESEPATAVTATPEDSKTPEKSYWRQASESKENLDIHQLLTLTIVSRISDNGNNQRNSSQFPKKKLASPPTSPIKQEDNKLLFNNLLSSKNDEDLQNMLNGNISEVSTDTKSFKEKLIMFEKLGK